MLSRKLEDKQSKELYNDIKDYMLVNFGYDLDDKIKFSDKRHNDQVMLIFTGRMKMVQRLGLI